ncbi:MAG: class III signal peptide-containing protein [Methanobacteriaceae archaeon]|nr:class III signal peptide-containing protein [Methanobacteriaceae archaeon]
MKIMDEEKAQGSAEMILIFGGIIVIAIVAAFFYRNYLTGLGNEINTTDVENVTNSISNLKNLF